MSSYQYGSAYRERPNNNDGYGKNEYGSGSHSRRNNITPKPYEHDPYGEGYSNGSDRYKNTSNSNTPPPPPQSSARHQPRSRDGAVWVPQPAQRMQQESDASRQIGIVLDRVKSEWPSMCQNDCVPVQMAIQLLDTSSVGKAHLYPAFQKTHTYLQDSLKNIVHEHHQGFNSSIGAYHKIQGSIQASQKRVRALKDSLASSKTAICATDPELKKLHKSSEMYDDLIQTLDELEELRLVPDQLEARISEKRFLNAVSVLQTALRKLRKTKLAGLGALSDLRSYLSNQETSLMDILVEELHDHLYLKSPYCQERWNCLAKTNKGNIGESNGSDNNWSAISGANGSPSTPVIPFQQLLDSIDFERHVSEDPSKNPEADTFHYIMLLVEALNKLGRLESAVDTLKQRLPVELFSVVNDTVVDMDQKHPASMRGSSSGTRRHVRSLFDDRETQMKRRVINDLLGNLYAKFEAIAEGHRIFHEAIKAIIRREGAGNNSALLGSFKELWNLYQNELRSLVHNYVTTEADVYQNTALHGGMGNVGAGGKRDNLYKFAEADPKASNILTESEALESIIEAAVPGLTSNSRSLQNSSNSKKGDISSGAVSSTSRSSFGLPSASRRSALSGTYSSNLQSSGSVKSLVEPSVFNMSLLLPGTLSFLQRLKNIVPPGSDLATSTLTSFLDNILVNVFQPQVDETLAKHCEAIYGSSESFLEDANWKHVAKKPIFMGTSDFYAIIAAFCAMLDTIPHDQALSTLILGQLNRYYERCSEWYQGLASHHQASMTEKPPLRYSARIANENNDIKNLMRKLAVMASPNGSPLDEEVDYFITKASKELNKEDDIMRNADQVKDKEGIAAMCLLYTSMKWLSVKVQALRFITKNNTDSSRFNKPTSKRWSQLNDAGRVREKQGSIYLPMTEETVQSFDSIVTSYEDLATTVLLTLHSEVRCRIVYSLKQVLLPAKAPYLLVQEVTEPDPAIIALNEDLIAYDEITTRHLRDKELSFIRSGLGRLIQNFIVANAGVASPMNAKGCHRMRLNILVLQQNLKNIEPGVDLLRATDYFTLFEKGADLIVKMAKHAEDKEDLDSSNSGEWGESQVRKTQETHNFTYDELKVLVELCYSEQMANPERGIATAAKRQMADRLLNLSEYMWSS